MRRANAEQVVLVNQLNEVLGERPKSEVHSAKTPLHRGFSVFVFARDGRLLVQRRSEQKQTWPLAWSNSCCGHPNLGESDVDAARRRLKAELSLTVDQIDVLLPDYRYCCVRDGIMENELCPVLVATTEHEPVPNPKEVAEIRWVSWPVFLAETERVDTEFSEWCVEEARLLQQHERFLEFLAGCSDRPSS
jgi:isopentenyl-diphosphate delta-isomerase